MLFASSCNRAQYFFKNRALYLWIMVWTNTSLVRYSKFHAGSYSTIFSRISYSYMVNKYYSFVFGWRLLGSHQHETLSTEWKLYQFIPLLLYIISSLIYGIHHWRILWSSYRKLAWAGSDAIVRHTFAIFLWSKVKINIKIRNTENTKI